MEDQIVGAFKKSETEEVRVTLRNYKGKAYLDIRVYFCTEGMDGFKPTKKGLTLAAELAPELEKAFRGVTFKTAGSLVPTV